MMKCYKCECEISIDDIFCRNCGAKLEKKQESNDFNKEFNIQNNNGPIKNDSTTFLILGIVLAMCCCFPIGISVILLNELKYKKLLANNNIEEANKTKNLMIILICVGIFVFFGFQILNILLSLIKTGVDSNIYV